MVVVAMARVVVMAVGMVGMAVVGVAVVDVGMVGLAMSPLGGRLPSARNGR